MKKYRELKQFCFATLLIREEVTPLAMVGGLLIFIGVFLITSRRRTKSPEGA